MPGELLFEELSYQIRGACIDVRKFLGAFHKEVVYHRALMEAFDRRSIRYKHEPSIPVYYPETGKCIGTYRPDFLIEDRVLVEVKAAYPLPSYFIAQLFDYLKNSKYELGLFVNFSGPKMYIARRIFTNDRKPFLSVTP